MTGFSRFGTGSTAFRLGMGGVCWMMGALLGCGASPSKAEALREQDAPSVTGRETQGADARSDAQDGAAGTVAADAVGIPSGLMRAQAWPKAAEGARWRALEDGQGVFIDEGIAGAHTFVFSSLSDSLPAAGILVHFPSTLSASQLPDMIAVSVSPTPIRVTREGWPSIAALLRHVGFAEFEAKPGDTLFFAFEDVERVSLLQLQLWAASSRASIGLGQVRLVHQRAVAQHAHVRRVVLEPLNDAQTLPEDANILGTDGRITLPHNQRPR